MSVIDFHSRIERVQADTVLSGGHGGGTFDGMEERVKRLEDDLKVIRSDVSYIRGRVDAMPTTIQLLGFVVAIFVAAGVVRYFGH